MESSASEKLSDLGRLKWMYRAVVQLNRSILPLPLLARSFEPQIEWNKLSMRHAQNRPYSVGFTAGNVPFREEPGGRKSQRQTFLASFFS